MRVALVGLLLLGAPAVPSAQSIAVVDVTVIPMDREATLAHQTVVVRGERILSVGPIGNTPVPDDAVIIDGAGRYLVPGLTDAHVHLPGTVFGPGRPQFGDAPLYLAYGVTTVLNLGGTPEHLDWRRRIITGERLAPTIYVSPPFFNEPRVNSPDDVESLAHVGELTRLYFNPVMSHRWSLIAGGIGLLIVLVVALRQPLAVMVRGRWLPREQLNAMLAALR